MPWLKKVPTDTLTLIIFNNYTFSHLKYISIFKRSMLIYKNIQPYLMANSYKLTKWLNRTISYELGRTKSYNLFIAFRTSPSRRNRTNSHDLIKWLNRTISCNLFFAFNKRDPTLDRKTSRYFPAVYTCHISVSRLSHGVPMVCIKSIICS